MRAEILAIGKCRDAAINSLVTEYTKRLSKTLPTQVIDCKTEADMLAKRSPKAKFIVLDERGKNLTTRAFADQIGNWQDDGIPLLQLAIGGADGHSDAVRQAADLTLSLSAMVLPHMLVRVIVTEQIYRAVSLNKGHPYHRD